MHILIVTPHLLQGSTLSLALKRKNCSSMVLSPLSLNYNTDFEADAVLFPHSMIKEQWELIQPYFQTISKSLPLIFFNLSDRQFFLDKAMEKLLPQCLFLSENLPLNYISQLVKEVVQKDVQNQDFAIGSFSLDITSRTLKNKQTSIELTRKEYYLLELFMMNTGRIISRDYIIDYVWDKRDYVAQNTIDVYISRLRKKLARLPEKPLIRTVPCLGYQMEI